MAQNCCKGKGSASEERLLESAARSDSWLRPTNFSSLIYTHNIIRKEKEIQATHIGKYIDRNEEIH